MIVMDNGNDDNDHDDGDNDGGVDHWITVDVHNDGNDRKPWQIG